MQVKSDPPKERHIDFLKPICKITPIFQQTKSLLPTTGLVWLLFALMCCLSFFNNKWMLKGWECLIFALMFLSQSTGGRKAVVGSEPGFKRVASCAWICLDLEGDFITEKKDKTEKFSEIWVFPKSVIELKNICNVGMAWTLRSCIDSLWLQGLAAEYFVKQQCDCEIWTKEQQWRVNPRRNVVFS